MLNVFNEGTSERTRKTSTQENSKLTWKTTERLERMMNPAMRVSEVVVMVGSQQIEGKPLFLLQVKCRNILNKI
jgi:hypothetical protein